MRSVTMVGGKIGEQEPKPPTINDHLVQARCGLQGLFNRLGSLRDRASVCSVAESAAATAAVPESNGMSVVVGDIQKLVSDLRDICNDLERIA